MASKHGIPKPPVGSDPFHVWAQWVHERLAKYLQFNNSPTVKVREGQRGYSFDAAPAQGGGGAASSNPKMKVAAVMDNYLVCFGSVLLGEGAMNTLTAYISSPGTGFTTGTYTLGITGGTGSGAAGTYVCAGGGVTQINFSTVGNYTVAPSLSFPSGSGTGAFAQGVLNAVYVALPPLFQRQTYDGNTVVEPDASHTYAYKSPGLRTDQTTMPVDGVVANYSFIKPMYLAGNWSGSSNIWVPSTTPAGWNDIIVCTPPSGTGVIVPSPPAYQTPFAVTLLDITPGRAWVVQESICYKGQANAGQLVPAASHATLIA